MSDECKHDLCSCGFNPKNIKVTVRHEGGEEYELGALANPKMFVDYCPLPSQIIYVPHGRPYAIVIGSARVELCRYFFRDDGQLWERWFGYHPETNTIVMSPLSLAQKVNRRRNFRR